MRFLYLDLAGSLTSKSSRYVVATFVSVIDPKILDYCVNRTRRKFKILESELKFRSTTLAQRKYLLSELVKYEEVEIAYTYYDKKEYGTEELFILSPSFGIPPDALRKDEYGKIIFTIDKGDFPIQAQDIFTSVLRARKNGRAIKDIRIVNSEEDKGIQVTDFVAGAIFQNYAYQDSQYYLIILPRIKTRIYLRP